MIAAGSATPGIYNAPPTPAELAERLGVDESALIKLDANENPYGAPPAALAALRDAAVNRYPDPAASALRAAISEFTDCDPERVVVGNGSDELIDLLCRRVLRPGDSVVTCPPTFSLYALAARVMGAEVVDVARGGDFALKVDDVLAAIDRNTKIVFLCSPNNPTGDLLSEADLLRVLAEAPLVALDEAYAEFAGVSAVTLSREYGNLVVLRTFSKAFGLAGLRVGYGVFPASLAQLLGETKLPYNVNSLAQAAAAAALGDIHWVEEKLSLIRAERERLFALLDALPGLEPLPSAANFLLVRSARMQARDTYTALLNRGIMVRHFSDPLLSDYLRITVGTPEQNSALLAALHDILEETV